MKNEIIKLLKITKVLESDYNTFEDSEDWDWKYCIDYFNIWCVALDYKINYESFYHFLLEYDEEGLMIDYLKILRFNSGECTAIMNLEKSLWCNDGLRHRIENSIYYNLIINERNSRNI